MEAGEEPLLLAELKPGRPHQFDWKSSCETWSVAFSPDGSWFAWSQGHCIVKLIPWPLEEQLQVTPLQGCQKWNEPRPMKSPLQAF
uniref:WD repeat and SOCS box containing 2 n=1 Tax=Ovis aries TaxID=9940 RepID=A0AC11DUU2_SHEEP